MRNLWLSGWGAVSVVVATACGGALELSTGEDESKGGLSNEASSGSAAGGRADPGSAGSDASPDEPRGGSDEGPVEVTDEPLTGCSGDPSVLGWQWNTACAYDVSEYCQRDGAMCIQSWIAAQNAAAWCGSSIVSAVSFSPSCNGYDVVSVHGTDATGDDRNLFNTYYYDSETGDLVHIDTNRIPSCTQCQGGESGSKFEIAGCESQFVDCS